MRFEILQATVINDMMVKYNDIDLKFEHNYYVCFDEELKNQFNHLRDKFDTMELDIERFVNHIDDYKTVVLLYDKRTELMCLLDDIDKQLDKIIRYCDCINKFHRKDMSEHIEDRR